MTRTGYWFNLLTLEWEQKRFPPYYENGPTPNALYNFRGKATLFGNGDCDEEGICTSTDVLQYDPDQDLWISMGRMIKSRTMHSVIEVPKTFCDVVTHPAPSQDTAAMVIGGLGDYDPVSGRRTILMSVELFGCPNTPDGILIEDFPQRVYLTAGKHFDVIDRDEQEPANGSVLVCGGYSCDPDQIFCRISTSCYEWTPDNSWQLRNETLDRSRWAHIMASVPDVNSGSNAQVCRMFSYSHKCNFLLHCM